MPPAVTLKVLLPNPSYVSICCNAPRIAVLELAA
jgi:hypothetical protein